MKEITKEEFKRELVSLGSRIDTIEEVAKELKEESHDAADLLLSTMNSNILAEIVAAKVVEIISSFLKVEQPPRITIK